MEENGKETEETKAGEETTASESKVEEKYDPEEVICKNYFGRNIDPVHLKEILSVFHFSSHLLNIFCLFGQNVWMNQGDRIMYKSEVQHFFVKIDERLFKSDIWY